jgi:hypothetical protein
MPRDKVFAKLLQAAWNSDIVTVVAAGNDGVYTLGNPTIPTTIDNVTPQRFGTDNNALITVGGAINNGSLVSPYRGEFFSSPGLARVEDIFQHYFCCCLCQILRHAKCPRDFLR